MKRKVIVEMFVEDEKAIEENMGTIEYLQREISTIRGSGIEAGCMRILDEDDFEDSEAIECTKKLFEIDIMKEYKDFFEKYIDNEKGK